MSGVGAGKIALVTGGNRGIGHGTCQRLGELGFKVLLGARDPALGAEAVEEFKKMNLDVNFIKVDLGDPSTLHAAAEEVKSTYKRLDVLINNAAIMDFENKMWPMDMARARHEMDVNFFGTVELTNALLPIMLNTSEAPRLVFVTTSLGSHETVDRPQNKYANPSFTAYKCSKAAVNMYCHNLAVWLQRFPEEAGGSAKAAKVNGCYPGYVATRMDNFSPDAHYTPYEGAETSVRLATLPEDGPTGGFYHLDKLLPW